MSKPAANPFFEVDFSKFSDFSKLASEFKGPLNLEPLMTAQRRNIEAFTAVNQTAYESMQALARRQCDAARQYIEDCASMMTSLMSAPSSPEEKMIRQAEVSKAAVEKCMANARDVADTLNKCNAQAMNVVANRLCEGLEEWRGMIKQRQQDAA